MFYAIASNRHSLEVAGGLGPAATKVTYRYNLIIKMLQSLKKKKYCEVWLWVEGCDSTL